MFRALFMHLIPTLAIAIALVAAWRHKWLGVLLFPAVGILFLYVARAGAARVVFAGIPFTIALLFLMSWFNRFDMRRH